jgi:hypothetical protein
MAQGTWQFFAASAGKRQGRMWTWAHRRPVVR